MPLPPTHMMSYLHYAYVDAVVSQAGATCTPYPKDYGFDARVSEIVVYPDGSHEPSGIGFDCQLKATTKLVESEDHFKYRLDVRTYNILARLKSTLGILIVYKMPEQEDEWLNQTKDALCLRDCCYWMEIPRKPTSHTSKVVVEIPQNQVFDRETVSQLLLRANGSVGAFLGG